MDALELARWQFAITTVYHFLFVPITIGMTAVVAGYHTAWVRTQKPEYLRVTKWLGKLFLINFALGLATGIVQEFQFGMNWSNYSRFVGDIFGAPLAFEALLAFFMESVFLGIWIFGWGRIPQKLHAGTMWMTHIGTVLSAYFILAANSFMQSPSGYAFNPETGRAEMNDFLAVLFSEVQQVTFPHVLTAAYMTAGSVTLGVGLYMMRRSKLAGESEAEVGMYRGVTRVGAIVTLIAGLLVSVTGHMQGVVMTKVQPMKMAAAEALYNTTEHPPFSVFSIGDLEGKDATPVIEIPGLLSFLADEDVVKGVNDLEKEYQGKFAEGTATIPVKQKDGTVKEMAIKDIQLDAKSADGKDIKVPLTKYTKVESYTPYVPLAYWSFRLMMGVGMLAALVGAFMLYATRGGRTPTGAWMAHAGWIVPISTVLGSSFGWIFTEIGRQPWIVYGIMATNGAESPILPAWQLWITMIGYTLVYAVLAVIEVKLFLTYTQRGAEPFVDPSVPSDEDEEKPLQFAY